MSALIDSEYSASINILKTNFFLHLWQDAHLMLPEEVKEEMVRENTVREQMQILNEEDAKRMEEYLAKKAAEEAAKQEQEQQENPYRNEDRTTRISGLKSGIKSPAK